MSKINPRGQLLFCLYNVQASKQETVDDDPTGVRWINSGLIGLRHKMKNIKKQRPIQRRKVLNLVYYISAGHTSLLLYLPVLF